MKRPDLSFMKGPVSLKPVIEVARRGGSDPRLADLDIRVE